MIIKIPVTHRAAALYTPDQRAWHEGPRAMPAWLSLYIERLAMPVYRDDGDNVALQVRCVDGTAMLGFEVPVGWSSAEPMTVSAPCVPCTKQEFLELLHTEIGRQLAIMALEA